MTKELKQAVSICEDITAAIETLTAAHEDYEGAAELPREDRREARDVALDEARGALDDILAEAAKLPELREAVAAVG